MDIGQLDCQATRRSEERSSSFGPWSCSPLILKVAKLHPVQQLLFTAVLPVHLLLGQDGLESVEPKDNPRRGETSNDTNEDLR